MKLFTRKSKTAASGPLERVEELMESNRERPDVATERELVRARHEAFAELLESDEPTAAATPGEGAAAARIEQGIPVLDVEDLSPAAARAAILDRGCVHVRGLLGRAETERLAAGIDRAFAGYDSEGPGAEEDPWYYPFTPSAGYQLGGGRKWNRAGGAIWAADSPRLIFQLLDTYERAGLREVISAYLGERPAMSMNKSVLRRVPPDTQGADWHQDGAFLGSEIRSLNVWVALSDCGRDAPGMDIVPKRLEEIVETGSEGANFDWSVSPAVVERVAAPEGVVRPEFSAGDALLFDHLNLHRTAAEPTMTKKRYAIETWFFAPSVYPEEQVPLAF